MAARLEGPEAPRAEGPGAGLGWAGGGECLEGITGTVGVGHAARGPSNDQILPDLLHSWCPESQPCSTTFRALLSVLPEAPKNVIGPLPSVRGGLRTQNTGFASPSTRRQAGELRALSSLNKTQFC